MDKALAYEGKKAIDYDSKRNQSNKWRKENEAVKSLFPYDARSVIDVPCGTGRFFDFYKSKLVHITGVDASQDMLIEARKKSKEAKLIAGDIRKLEGCLPDQSFDVAVCCRLTGWLNPVDLHMAMFQLMDFADYVIVGIRTNESKAFAKGKLWNHSHEHFLECCKPGVIEDSVLFGKKGYGFYRIRS